MIPPGFESCRKCGGDMERESQPDASPLIMVCNRCGHRERAEIQVSPPWPAEDPAYARVIVEAAGGQEKMHQIRALRRLDPHLSDLPADKAMKILQSNKPFDLGIHRLDDARLLLEKARALNLTARLAGPEERWVDDQDGGKLFESFGAPVTVGRPGEGTRVVSFVWVVLGVVLIAALLVWTLWG